jgi:hypothetical protein
MINPPARPVVKDGTNLWIQAEALLMHPTEDNVNYGIKQENSAAPFDGRVKNISYDWSWGWRAGLGYNLCHDGWDVLLNYTWFRSGESDTTNTDASEVIYQTWTNPANTFSDRLVTKAKGLASLKFSYLDFQLGREFFVSKWLTLRPYLGARGTWTHRSLKAKYKNVSDNFKLKEKLNNRFRGGGLLAGLDSQWGLGMGWSIYGQAAVSLLYGTQHLHETQDLTTGGSETRIAVIRDSWATVRTLTDLGVGFRWDHLFYDDAYRIRLQLGWEQHLLSGFDKDINLTDDVMQGKFVCSQGDLAVSGIAFQARFDF